MQTLESVKFHCCWKKSKTKLADPIRPDPTRPYHFKIFPTQPADGPDPWPTLGPQQETRVVVVTIIVMSILFSLSVSDPYIVVCQAADVVVCMLAKHTAVSKSRYGLLIIIIIIIIIIAPLSILSEHELGDLECLYKARQAATTDAGLFTGTCVHERGASRYIHWAAHYNNLWCRLCSVQSFERKPVSCQTQDISSKSRQPRRLSRTDWSRCGSVQSSRETEGEVCQCHDYLFSSESLNCCRMHIYIGYSSCRIYRVSPHGILLWNKVAGVSFHIRNFKAKFHRSEPNFNKLLNYVKLH